MAVHTSLLLALEPNNSDTQSTSLSAPCELNVHLMLCAPKDVMMTRSLFCITSPADLCEKADLLTKHYGKMFSHHPKNEQKLNELICKLAGYPGGYQQFCALRLKDQLSRHISEAIKIVTNLSKDPSTLVFSQNKECMMGWRLGVKAAMPHEGLYLLPQVYEHNVLGYVSLLRHCGANVDAIDLDRQISEEKETFDVLQKWYQLEDLSVLSYMLSGDPLATPKETTGLSVIVGKTGDGKSQLLSDVLSKHRKQNPGSMSAHSLIDPIEFPIPKANYEK